MRRLPSAVCPFECQSLTPSVADMHDKGNTTLPRRRRGATGSQAPPTPPAIARKRKIDEVQIDEVLCRECENVATITVASWGSVLSFCDSHRPGA